MPIKKLHTISLVTIAAAFAMLLLIPGKAVGQIFGGSTQGESSSDGDMPFVHGVTIGAGITTFHGDVSRNPNDNVLKYLSSATPSLLVRADRRFGQFQQFGANVELQYHRLSAKTGSSNGPIEVNNNLVALDFTADYELPYIQQGLFRVFLGVGPLFLISPSYSNFPEDNENFDALGSRVVGSLVFGVSMFDTFRIGMRIPTSDYTDGYIGFDGKKGIDIYGFVGVTRRFSFR